MAVNLEKVAKDLAGDDEDVQLLALTAIVQLTPASVEDPEHLGDLKRELEAAVEADRPDTVFLARKGLNHLEDLQRRLAEGTPREAPQAREETRPLTREQALEVLEQAGSDPVQGARALAALARHPLEGADRDRLLPFLAHEDDRVRANAVEAVEATRDPEFMIPALSPLLEDRSNRARANASKALGGLGEPRVLETLGQMVSSANLGARESAVYAMSYLKGPPVLELLVRCLRDPFEGVRSRACRALARHKDPRVLPALRQALNDIDIEVCEEADRAISFIQMESGQPVREGFEAEGPSGPSAAPSAAPAGTDAAADSPEVAAARARRAEALREAGQRVFDLCRAGALEAGSLDKAFYDTLQLEEFLLKHRERIERGALDAGDVNQALAGLQAKIHQAHRELGAQALDLVARGEVSFEGSAALLEALEAADRDIG